MCTYTNCVQSARTYSNVDDWWQHESGRHRVQRNWKCTPCEQTGKTSEFETSTSFDAHITQQHPIKLTQTQLQNIRESCRQEIGAACPSTQCPLCKKEISCKRKNDVKAVERRVRKHVSKHLEQLSFFVALPAGQMVSEDDDSEFQDDSDSEGGVKTEIDSIVSEGTHLSKKHVRIANVHRFMTDQEKTIDGIIHEAIGTGSTKNDSSGKLAQDDSDNRKALVFDPPAAPLGFPIRLMIHPPNEHFYARQSLLADADKVLQSPGSICLFHGVGGVGKTLAAVQYVYTHQDQYDAIFWLQAATAPGLSDSYLQMAKALKLFNGAEDHHQVWDKARSWLQKTGMYHVLEIRPLG